MITAVHSQTTRSDTRTWPTCHAAFPSDWRQHAQFSQLTGLHWIL